MASALVLGWKALRPEDPVDVLVLPALAAVARAIPGVDEVLVLPVARGSWSPLRRWRFGRALRGRYAVAVVLPRAWKAALVPWAAGVPRRTGVAGEFRWPLVNDPRPPPSAGRSVPQSERYRRLATGADTPLPDPLPEPRLVASAERGRALLRAYGGGKSDPWVVLAPGAEYGPAKRWPTRSYAALARALHERGRRTVALGTRAERPLGHELARAGTLDLSGRTTLAEALDVVAAAEAFVGNDSGLLHVARALGRPALGVYGSSDPGATAPPGARVVSRRVPCSPCFARVCRYGHTMCLRDLAPRTVLEAFLPLLETGTRA
jgi:heptosyltransferase-2